MLVCQTLILTDHLPPPGLYHGAKTHTVGCGKLDEDAVAAQSDDEGLPAHTAALRLSGHRALEHTHIFICKKEGDTGMSGSVLVTFLLLYVSLPPPLLSTFRFFWGAPNHCQVLWGSVPAYVSIKRRYGLTAMQEQECSQGPHELSVSSLKRHTPQGKPGHLEDPVPV